jgi:preprotein translocase subunit YajC
MRLAVPVLFVVWGLVASPAAADDPLPGGGGDPAAGTGDVPPPGAGAAEGEEYEEEEAGGFLNPQCGMQILMLVGMFAIFYFLLIRPQQKKAKEHQEMLKQLRRGDRIITSSGIYGTITGIDDKVAVVEISEKVRVKMLRSQIAGKAGDPGVDSSVGASK